MKKNSRIKYILFISALIYLILLVILIISERRYPDATITSIGDALWYSFITMTSVGYGDMYPVSLTGRIIGILFSFVSVGLIALALGFAGSFLVYRWIPLLRLMLRQNDTWVILAGDTDTLTNFLENMNNAIDSEHTDDGFLYILPSNRHGRSETPVRTGSRSVRIMTTDYSAEQILRRRSKRPTENTQLYFLYPDDRRNISLALRYRTFIRVNNINCTICCKTNVSRSLLPKDIRVFNEISTASRLYWHSNGLLAGERNIMIIGEKDEAEGLLEQGLLINVYQPGQQISYHLFNSDDDYFKEHWCLGKFTQEWTDDGSPRYCVRLTDESGDRIYMHSALWNDDPDLLKTADRIILCGNDADNLRILSKLRNLFNIRCQICVLCDGPMDGSLQGNTVFWEFRDRLYTPALLLNETTINNARALHNTYVNAFMEDFHRRSNMAEADHVIQKVRILLDDRSIPRTTPDLIHRACSRWTSLKDDPVQLDILRRIEHIRWVRFHLINNWEYAPERSDPDKKHPFLVPYDSLPEEGRTINDRAWDMLESYEAPTA